MIATEWSMGSAVKTMGTWYPHFLSQGCVY